MFIHGAKIDCIKTVFFSNSLTVSGNINEYPQKRNHCELIFKYSGISYINYENECFTEYAGNIRFMPMTTEKCIYKAKALEPGAYCYFSFTGSGLPERMVRTKISGTNIAHIGSLFTKMFNLWTAKKDGYEYLCLSLAYRILGEIERQEYVPSKTEKMLAPAVDYISSHIYEKIDCNILAQMCNLSYSYFKTVFKRTYGLPPVQYISKKKIDIACEQLRQSDNSISMISQMLGYCDAAYFSSVFKKEVGCTAQEYRERLR